VPEPFRGSGFRGRFRAAAPIIRMQNETAIYLTGNERFELSHAYLNFFKHGWKVFVKYLCL
jgi:hypothetical protein